MKSLIIAGIGLVMAVQVLAFVTLDRQLVVVVAGVAVAVVLVAVRWRLAAIGSDVRDAHPDVTTDGADEKLSRWLARTETLIAWSEASRADWDRRLRPVLARQFEMAAGHRKAKDPNAFNATGRMLFGQQLWQWVDPDNISRTGRHEPGPGRDALSDILQRLERL